MKLRLIHLLDKLDGLVLRHRVQWVCCAIGMSSWWGAEDCPCSFCAEHRDFES